MTLLAKLLSGKYIIRLDDACPTMDIKKWDWIESLLDDCGITPIVGVIPDNQDAHLMIDKEDSQFWDKVKCWQGKGWEIAMHGYQHKFCTDLPGIIPINHKSEFAGLPLKEQKNKIKKAWQCFLLKGIKTDVFMAPAHSFDCNTLAALTDETSITTITDGFSLHPYYKDNFWWVPQQLWKFRWMPFGIWTICLHPNQMTKNEMVRFEKDLLRYRQRCIAFPKFMKKRNKSIMDRFFSFLFLRLLQKKRRRHKKT